MRASDILRDLQIYEAIVRQGRSPHDVASQFDLTPRTCRNIARRLLYPSVSWHGTRAKACGHIIGYIRPVETLRGAYYDVWCGRRLGRKKALSDARDLLTQAYQRGLDALFVEELEDPDWLGKVALTDAQRDAILRMA